MTQLTPDNWKEIYRKRCEGENYVSEHLLKDDIYYEDGRPAEYVESVFELDEQKVEDFIDQLLSLQKQALKDEAVKRIEEEWQANSKCEGDTSYFAGRSTGLINAINIIRNLD